MKAIDLYHPRKEVQEKRVIYEKIGILQERDPKCRNAKAVNYSKIEIVDVCGNSFTF